MNDPKLARLGEQEREILALMAEGCSNATIAARVCLSTASVERHISAVFAKLELPHTANRRVLAVLSYLSQAPRR
ncbi:helix-turn-helix transcriptional regulator [Streptosporangium sp. NPDC002544]|jgi:DNA-binding NarL/FixJ family response regulator|uniref:response regulator transcription factor n=1 Tax=Streptosporangium sp. NPDC002544 TaxID=3154538 RepID=UPI00332B5E78